MNDDQKISRLWAFVRGDTPGPDFERWVIAENGLEELLGPELHWELISGSYQDRDSIWHLRKLLEQVLDTIRACVCLSLRDSEAIPMLGDGLDERVFATIDRIKDYGGHLWWLNLSKCSVCAQHWMIAQEERTFDQYFLRRVDVSVAGEILTANCWPSDFLTYEQVLAVGIEFCQPCVYYDSMSPALVATAHDLRKERPDITVDRIAHLIGTTAKQVHRLLRAKP